MTPGTPKRLTADRSKVPGRSWGILAAQGEALLLNSTKVNPFQAIEGAPIACR